MNNEDLQKLKTAAEGCEGWTWPDRRRDENGTHHFGRRTEDGEFYDMGTIDAWTYTSDYADDLRVLKFIRQVQPKDILSLVAEVEQARAANAWEPIESAPKDGTPILVLKKGFHPAVARWLEGQWMTANNEANYSDGKPCYLEWHLTHWQHLPDAPQ